MEEKKKELDKIIEEGFEYSGKKWYDFLMIYKKEKEHLLYHPDKDIIIRRYKLEW